jgi:plasmid stabilization system protein ParE
VEEYQDPTVKEVTVKEVYYDSYRIVYRFDGKIVEILAVHHAAQLLPGDLFESD